MRGLDRAAPGFIDRVSLAAFAGLRLHSLPLDPEQDLGVGGVRPRELEVASRVSEDIDGPGIEILAALRGAEQERRLREAAQHGAFLEPVAEALRESKRSAQERQRRVDPPERDEQIAQTAVDLDDDIPLGALASAILRASP